MKHPIIPKTQPITHSLRQSSTPSKYNFRTLTPKLKPDSNYHRRSTNFQNRYSTHMECENNDANESPGPYHNTCSEFKPQNENIPIDSNRPQFIKYQDANIEEKDRPYLVQYLTIIYHIDCFIDLKKTSNLQNVLTCIYINETNSSPHFKLITQKMLSFHSKILPNCKNTYKIISYMLQDMKITEEEYNNARKKVASLILSQYRQALTIIPLKDPEFQQFLGIKINKYKQQAEKLLSEEKDLKIIFNLFKYMKTSDAKNRIANKNQINLESIQSKRKQPAKNHRQKRKLKLQAERLQQQKQEQERKQRLRRNYVLHFLLTEIYSKKYDVQTDHYFIDSMVSNIVSQLAVHEKSQIESPEKVSMVQAVSKSYHMNQIKKCKGVDKLLAKGNQKISEEEKTSVKSQIAKNFLKTWYEDHVCHVIFPKGKLFVQVQKEAAQYQRDHGAFIEDAQNLVLLNRFLKESEIKEKAIIKLREAGKQSKWSQEMAERFKDFVLICQESDQNKEKEGFSIMLMQFLVDDISKDEGWIQLEGKSLLQIVTSSMEKWLCSTKHKQEHQLSGKHQLVLQEKYQNQNGLNKKPDEKRDMFNQTLTKESLEAASNEMMDQKRIAQRSDGQQRMQQE